MGGEGKVLHSPEGPGRSLMQPDVPRAGQPEDRLAQVGSQTSCVEVSAGGGLIWEAAEAPLQPPRAPPWQELRTEAQACSPEHSVSAVVPAHLAPQTRAPSAGSSCHSITLPRGLRQTLRAAALAHGRLQEDR